MKFLRFLFFICVAVVSGKVCAQSQRELGQLMRERNEYYFTLTVNQPTEIQAINELCSVDDTDGRTVVCYANQQQYDRLLQAGYQPNLQTPPSLREEARMWEGGDRATYEWDSYPTYEQYESMMQGFGVIKRDRLCSYMELGTLPSGRKIMGIRINNGNPEGKPKFLYTSTIHGDETTGWIMLLRLIDEFCTSTDSRIVNLIDNLDIFIFPNANPDGTYHNGNSSVSGATRANANGVDMNRNYPDPHSSAHPDGNAYQTETQWFMQLAETYPFVMAANYHGGAEVVNYPWDNTSTRHADDAWWQYVSREYANLAHAVSSSYMTDENNGITNGADWYTIGGGRQDYMNGYRQCREVTVECSTDKNPSASYLPSFWNYNHNAMLTYMEECLYGVHGFVYDGSNNNQPLDGVTVTVMDHDDEYSIVSTHEDGYFHRPIKGGTYTFAFEKDGYCPYFAEVTVADGQRVDLDIELTPGSCLVPNFTASTTDVSLGSSINFTDASYGDIVSWNWTFEGATPSTSTAQNPTNITYNTTGTFDVTLVITDGEGNSQIIIKEDYINVAASYNMSNTSVTTCDALFYDSGGADSNYGNNLTYTMTFYPENEGAFVSVAFSQFNTESNYDFLYIYDGESTNDTQIGKYSGSNSPGTVTATNNAGALTFKFTSDSYTVASGWVATVSCVSLESNTITATANPTGWGTIEGAGTYVQGHTCTLTATAAAGYSFANWTENDEVVSSDATYSFQVTTDRTLVANFIIAPAVPMDCYYTETNIAVGSYVMGYLNGSTLVIPTHNNGTANTTSVDVTVTEYGFSAEDGALPGLYALTAYGNNGQYCISYNGRYLARSTSGGGGSGARTITWSTSQSSNTAWYINSNGVTQTSSSGWSGSSTYYLYYNNGSFYTSTTGTKNITFYVEGDCPAPTTYSIIASSNPSEGGTITGTGDYVEGETCTLTATANEGYAFINWTESGVEVSTEATYSFMVTCDRTLVANFEEVITTTTQNTTFATGWNWWTPNVDITLEQLENALGSNGILIKDQNGNSVSYDPIYGWGGDELTLEAGKMYKIEMNGTNTISLEGQTIDPATHGITLKPGNNWIGFFGTQSVSLDVAFENLTATDGDVITSQNGTSSSYDATYGWGGDLTELEPGKAYIYNSKDTVSKTFFYPSSK